MKFQRSFLLFLLILALLSFPHNSLLQEPKDNLELPENLTLNADLNVRGVDLVIAGQVQGKIDLVNGSLRVLGKVAKSVSVRNGDIFLDENSLIGGDVLCVNGSVQRSENSQVSGKVQEIEERVKPEARPPEKARIKKGVFHRILVNQYAAVVVLSPLLLLSSILFLGRLRIIKNAIEERPIRCLAAGAVGVFLWLFVTWSLPGLYFVIPAFRGKIFQKAYLPVMILLLLPFLLAGVSACLYSLGRKLLRLFEISTGKHIIASVVGLVFIVVVGFIPVAGWLLWMCVLLFGIGASLLTRLGTRQVMPKVRLQAGEQRRSIPQRFWRKPIIAGVSLALLLPLMLVLGYFSIYVFSPGLLGFAKPEYSVKEAYSVKQLDFVQPHFRLEMQNAYYIPFYLAGHKVGALISGEGRYFFSLVKDAPAQAEGNIVETKLSKVYALADSEGYFSQFEKKENLVSEDVEILRRAKDSLDRIVLQAGKVRRVHGVIRKKIGGSKLNLFSLRLSGQDRGEAFAYRTFADVVKYHSTSFKGPLIEILY